MIYTRETSPLIIYSILKNLITSFLSNEVSTDYGSTRNCNVFRQGKKTIHLLNVRFKLPLSG